MTAKPDANAIKKMFREIQGELPPEVDLGKLVGHLANRQESVELIKARYPGVEPSVLRRALAKLGGLIGQMERWTDPSETLPKKPAAAPAPATSATHDDPSILRQYDRVKVFTDGASKGNPGPASVGIVIQDLEGETLYEEGLYLGIMTNNAAEYRGLIHALEILIENGAPETFAFLDSALVVNQVNLQWKVKHPDMQPHFNQVQQLKRQLPQFRIHHIGREKNSRADELANLAYRQHRDAHA